MFSDLLHTYEGAILVEANLKNSHGSNNLGGCFFWVSISECK